ncbi:hypothetical protein GCM10009642_47720 [Nocardiopsis metallicus]
MAGDQQRALIGRQGVGQLPHAGQVQVVGGLVQHQQLRRRCGQHRRRQGRPEALTAGQGPGDLRGPVALEQEPGQLGADVLGTHARRGVADVLRDADSLVEDVQPLR